MRSWNPWTKDKRKNRRTLLQQTENINKETNYRDAWVAQSVKHPTLGFSSGHDLTVCGFELHVGLCADRAESASAPLSLCPSPSHTLSLKNK